MGKRVGGPCFRDLVCPITNSNQDHTWNLLHLLAVTLSTRDTVTFEILGNFHVYMEEYHESGMEWWEGTPWYIGHTAKSCCQKRIRWNSDLPGTDVWKYFQHCSDRVGSAIGMPRVMCIMCRKDLAHPSGTGASLIHDNNKSTDCLKPRKINRYDGWARSPLGIYVLMLLQKGPITGNRGRIIDLATPA